MNTEALGRLAITVLCLLMFGAFAGYLVATKTSDATVQLLAGALISWVGAGVQYFLGSSAGSAAKDKIVATLTNKAP